MRISSKAKRRDGYFTNNITLFFEIFKLLFPSYKHLNLNISFNVIISILNIHTKTLYNLCQIGLIGW